MKHEQVPPEADLDLSIGKMSVCKAPHPSHCYPKRLGYILCTGVVLLLFVSITRQSACAATQIGSAPYRASASGAGNSYAPVFSADGKHVAFVSHANNLVTNDDLGPHLDLFVRDLAASNTVLVSVSTNGFGGANDNIGLYTLSSNAQVVAFDTAANNLVAWDNNRVSDVYVRNLEFGGITRVSMGVDGDANGPSSNPLISEDGRYVIFESLASNLVTNDFNGTNDIFIHDLNTGFTELVSVNTDGTASPNGPSHSPSISADGLTVAFVSHATNLVEGVTNTLGEVYARNVAEQSTRWAVASHLSATRLSTLPNGVPAALPGPYIASEPVLSADGRFVVFKTVGQTVRFDLHRPTNRVIQFFPPSPVQGASSNYFLFDDNPRLAASASEIPLWSSRDGRFTAYTTRTNFVKRSAALLVDFDSFVTNTIYDSGQGSADNRWVTNKVVWANTVLTNVDIPFPNPGKKWTQMPWLAASQDGSRLVVLAETTNFVAGVTNRAIQIYSVDVNSGAIQIISTNSGGEPCLSLNGIVPASSPDGSLIAWDSPDDSIVADDLNRAWDVFVRNVDTGETQLISARHPGLPAASGTALSRLDLNPGAISANGQRLAILSLDSTLAPDDTNAWRDLFVRDLTAGSTIALIPSVTPRNTSAVWPSLSTDGRFAAFAAEGLSSILATNRAIYWRDLEAATNRTIHSESQFGPAGLSLPTLSADGRFVAFSTTERLELDSDVNNVADIYLYIANFTPAYHVWRNLIAVSVTNNVYRSTGNGTSINPVFSPDSTWLAFQSTATDLTPDPDTTPGRYQLFARQFLTDQTNLAGGLARLISYTTAASSNLDGRSLELPLAGGAANPRFSADSRHVAFEGGTNLIYRHDLLDNGVVTISQQDGLRFTNIARLTNLLVCVGCANPTMNSDGRFVAYESRPATGGPTNVFVKDLETGQSVLVSVNHTGSAGGNGSSYSPLISHDARFVVFASKASDLVPGDSNRATDIFVRDRVNGVTHCLSHNWSGTGTGNRVSSNPILSADGRTVAFQSFASDLVHGDYNDTRDVFVVTLAGPDSEGDGMDDDWEMAYFSTLARDGSGDFDGDGASDLDEFRAGTNPANNGSILRVLRLTTSAMASPNRTRTTVLLWSASPGKTYRVQFKEDINTPWADLPGDITAGGTSASTAHSVFTSTPPGFYRVSLVR